MSTRSSTPSEASFASYSSFNSGLYVPVHRRNRSGSGSSNGSATSLDSCWRPPSPACSDRSVQSSISQESASPVVSQLPIYSIDMLLQMANSPLARMATETREALRETVPMIVMNRRQRKYQEFFHGMGKTARKENVPVPKKAAPKSPSGKANNNKSPKSPTTRSPQRSTSSSASSSVSSSPRSPVYSVGVVNDARKAAAVAGATDKARQSEVLRRPIGPGSASAVASSGCGSAATPANGSAWRGRRPAAIAVPAITVRAIAV